MHVIGTAGHVDHGKSTLVQALTDIDPDRLREEKERGMTIDLGFAWLRLPGGDEVSIVDVPGHEHFVNNMLAGVGGVDLALLVVAADESVMPQTREHMAILDLLDISRGLVAVTKRDLVDRDWLDLVVLDVKDLLEETSLAGADILAVSGTTGEGLAELVTAIERLLDDTEVRRDVGRPRLPIDRSFTMPGFGAVVTGTLIDGKLSVGQEVEILPGRKEARIRGIQTHRRKLDETVPGSRVAANLSGIGHGEIRRGDVLASPGWLEPTTAMDVSLSVLSDAPRALRHNMFVTVHTGSSETEGRLRLLEADKAEPGDTAWAQIKLERPLAAVKGDYFVVRSNRTTLGGGSIVDPHAKRHRRRHRPVLERLAVMQRGSPRDVLLKSIETAEPAELAEVVSRANLEPAIARSELEAMEAERLVVGLGSNGIGPGAHLFTSTGWASVSDGSRKFLDSYHLRFPLRRGAPKEELRSRLGMSAQVFAEALPRLERDGVLVEDGPDVRRPDHRRRLSDEQRKAAAGYLSRLTAAPYSPPTDSPIEPEILGLLVDDGQAVKVSETVVFAAPAYEEMVDDIRGFVRDNGQITVADVRDLFGTSRKYALSLLEHLDAQRVTRRVGDARVLRQPSPK